MNPKKRSRISQLAAGLLDQHNVSSPPVPVARIAKSLQIRIRFSPLDDELSGMIYVRRGVPIIGVNSLHHPNRQRFTVAHECGHFLLHKQAIAKEVHVDKAFPMLMRDSVSSLGVNDMEMEANFFAAELLMPVGLLREALDGDFIDIDEDIALAVLARSFKVSQSAMRYRLGYFLAWN